MDLAPPRDIESFCSIYPELDREERKAFWVQMFAAMVMEESTNNPAATHVEKFEDSNQKSVVSRGLLQISFESAKRTYKCPVTSDEQLHNPRVNLECAVKIMTKRAADGKFVTGRQKSSWQGAARYWGALRSKKKLERIRAQTSAFCQRLPRSA